MSGVIVGSSSSELTEEICDCGGRIRIDGGWDCDGEYLVELCDNCDYCEDI